jgi:heat shock protein HspQ
MARFEVGELVHHKRYKYRGVIAASDPRCLADDFWYQRNQTQPDREQTWYHVLVHGGQQTYVAEENLEADTVGKPIAHPLVRRLFGIFIDGRYKRFSPN